MNFIAEKFKRSIILFVVAVGILGCSSEDDNDTGIIDPGTDEEVPIAVDDEVSTAENTAITIEGLLENDTVHEFARITDFDAETEQGGSVVDNRDNTYTYTPPEDYIGEDSFEYTICDNATSPNCSTATVNITITEASPVAVDDSYETTEDRSINIRSYLENDQVVDNATVTSVDSEDANATVVLEADGKIRYTPNVGFSGVDSFTYTLCDDDEEPTCSTATVTVNVTDEGSPVANDDLIIIGTSRSQITIEHVLDNDNLIDDAVLTSIDASGSQGTIVLNSDGSITYTGASGFVGEDTFTYTLCDDDLPEPTCSEATVTVQIVESLSFTVPSELEDYYSNFIIPTDAELNYTFLSNFTSRKHTTILSYGQRHDYLYEADEDPENSENVILMYSGESRYWREYTSGNNSYSPQTFNTEHVYPQSRLTANDAVTDLHHLRVSDADVNSLRSNYPFTEGSGDYELINENTFYPGDEWKGDVARMIMYLNVRYGETFQKVGNIELFLKWNREDPVSAFEMQRNDVIEGAQGNRNPFIDNPYLATLIWEGEPAENKWD